MVKVMHGKNIRNPLWSDQILTRPSDLSDQALCGIDTKSQLTFLDLAGPNIVLPVPARLELII